YSLEDVKKYYLQFFLNISNMIRADSIYLNHDTIDQICTYLSKNYQKDLSQEFIASLFYLNRSYLSQLFKKKTGEKFVDYLNNIRIEKAKELLAGTDKDICTIARSTGYENTKYFFRVFKKKTGTSPEVYRQGRQVQK
ncbi:MAG: AraC family transcriptional regulator, partial [Lachnospiraceae bacterium]|nr:AraC family transcriptional regulator [Lachnospiraceae bacterium]